MRLVDKIRIAILIVVCSFVNLNSQNITNDCSEISSQAVSLMNAGKIEDALSVLSLNEEKFNGDEYDKFLYEWMFGIMLCKIDKYNEAKKYIDNAIFFLDVHLKDFLEVDAFESVKSFVIVYYLSTRIDYELSSNKATVYKKLDRAKYIYETVGAESDIVYTTIMSDLCNLDKYYIQIAEDTMDLFYSKKYQELIPLAQQIVDFYLINRPDDFEGVINFAHCLAFAYQDVGDYKNSEKYYILAVNTIEDNNLQNNEQYRRILNNLSSLYVELQNLEKARLLNGRAKILYEKAMDFGDEYVVCLCSCAAIQAKLGYGTVAKMQVDVALRVAKNNLLDLHNINPSLYTICDSIYFDMDGMSPDDRYLILSRLDSYIILLSNSSAIYADLGYYSDAIRNAKESVNLSEKYGFNSASSYNNLGMLYLRKNKFLDSIEWFEKAYKQSRTPYENDEIGMNLALSLYYSNDSERAQFCSDFSDKIRSNIINAFRFMSGQERAIYWKHYENYLSILNHIIYEGGDNSYYGNIYDNILESKGLLLRSTNAIRDAILNSGNTSDIADYTRIGKLKQQLLNEKDRETRLAIEKEIEAIDKRLTQHVNTYADFVASKNIRWEDVRNALAKKEAAIEFYNIPHILCLDSIQRMDGERIYCAVILKKEYKIPHIIPLCKETQLANLDREDLYETDSIYNLIWHPLEEELEGVHKIYFAADRDLHKIGIEYARMPGGGIIVDKYRIYRLSSTRVLAENNPMSKKEFAVLYGGLKYDIGKDELIAESRSGDYHPTSVSRAFTDENFRYGVKYLPGTLKEVEEISQSFNRKPRMITDMRGTEESFKSLAGSDIDIIHLATHGFFWSKEDAQKRDYVTFLNPLNRAGQSLEDKALMRSGLFFSGANIGLKGEELPDNVEDGVLTALELSNMNLGHVDMVVMSACESGLGETSGEGVFGLQRGFKLAGANTLLMSLWKVDDTATQMLMTDFYKNYLSGMSKQESLKYSQQMLRNTPEYSDPVYWAAFILLDALN